MQATRDSEIPVGEARELDYLPSWYRTGTDYDSRLYNANIYHNAQAADSMLAYDDEHPLQDSSLEMLGRVILLAIAVLSLAVAAILWWRV